MKLRQQRQMVFRNLSNLQKININCTFEKHLSFHFLLGHGHESETALSSTHRGRERIIKVGPVSGNYFVYSMVQSISNV